MKDVTTIDLDERLLEMDTDYGRSYANSDDAIKELKDGIKTNKYFSGLCIKCDADGNLNVDINGVICFMERNEVSIANDDELVHKGICQKKVGSYIKAKVLKIENENTDSQKILVSRKELVQNIRLYYNTKLTVGTIVTGKVANIDETKGVFIDIGGDLVGIISRKYLENLFVTNLSSHVSIGEKIQAVVLELVKNDNGNIIHIALDRKSLLPKFNKLALDYKHGEIVLCKIKSIQPNGIFCSLDKHLDIICNFDDNKYRIDESVRVRISTVNYGKQRITGTIISKI